MAIVVHGFNRGAEDIDLLVERTASNMQRLREALSILPDNAAHDLRDSDIEQYCVVRVADEVVVNLMGNACGVDFESAQNEIDWREFEGLRIPFASPALLLRTKQTVQEKDAIDRLFLERLIAEKRGSDDRAPPSTPPSPNNFSRRTDLSKGGFSPIPAGQTFLSVSTPFRGLSPISQRALRSLGEVGSPYPRPPQPQTAPYLR